MPSDQVEGTSDVGLLADVDGGVVLMGVAFEATRGVTRAPIGALNSATVLNPVPLTRFSIVLISAVTFGWSLTLMAVVQAKALRNSPAASSPRARPEVGPKVNSEPGPKGSGLDPWVTALQPATRASGRDDRIFVSNPLKPDPSSSGDPPSRRWGWP